MFSIPLDISETAIYRKLWNEAFGLFNNNDERADQVHTWLSDMRSV